MDFQILSAALQSREAWSLLKKYLNPKDWARETQILLDFISDYYGRDKAAEHVDMDVLNAIIASSTQNEKHAAKFTALAKEARETDISVPNVKELVLSAKRTELAEALAMAISNGKKHDKLLGEYVDLLGVESLEQDSTLETYTIDDIITLLEADADRSGVVPIYPKALGDRMDGGLLPGDAMIIIARPEMGKTALILTIVCAIARSGKKAIVFNNEEAISRLYVRAICCMTGLTIREVRANIPAAVEQARERGFGNLIFISMSPGSPQQIEAELEKHPDAVLFVTDQLRNLVVKAENRTNQLEAAAQEIRNIAKRRKVVSIAVTQAGDSGQNKSILDMGDVDNSNTGIPGACDVLLGVGANEKQREEGIRVLTLIKNKTTGNHESFPCRINPLISKYVSL